nr:unnamed protein product [Spirometra erinaceieuropaei]
MDLFSAACENFGLIVNTQKTVVIHQPLPDAAYVAAQIIVNGAKLQVVDNFTYLDSMLFRNTQADDEVARRISEASQAVGRLQNNVWNRHDLHLNTKLKMYRAVILPTLLHGAETWTVNMRQTRRLNHFHLFCLRRILKLRLKNQIANTDELNRTGIFGIHDMLRPPATALKQLIRADGRREPIQTTLLWRCCDGFTLTGWSSPRLQGAPKTSLKHLQISPANWVDLTRDQPSWRRTVKIGAAIYEANRITRCQSQT